jgi:hypothetical protein
VVTIAICLLVVMSIASVAGAMVLGRNATPDPRRNPALLSYLAARNYTSPPRVDARPPSLGSLYGDAVLGVADGMSFALTVTTVRSRSVTALFLVGDGARVGTWFCTPHGSRASSDAHLGAFARMYVATQTNDPSFDARVETYHTGSDGPSGAVRAQLLSFPGGIETAGWTEGRVVVSMVTTRELEEARLDAAFALARAIALGMAGGTP